MPLTAFADLELPDLDLADIEVVTIRDALAVPDTGATSGSSSCKSWLHLWLVKLLLGRGLATQRPAGGSPPAGRQLAERAAGAEETCRHWLWSLA